MWTKYRRGVARWAIGFNLLLISANLFAENQPASPDTAIGQPVANFVLNDHLGVPHALDDYADQRLVVLALLGTECPLAKLYSQRLISLASSYGQQGVIFLGIFSNYQDSSREIAEYARKHHISFPLLKDTGHRIADTLAASRTPEVFVLDDARRLRYRGRIDDQYGIGYQRPKPLREDLRAALDSLLSGQLVEQPVTRSIGCIIGRSPVTVVDTSVTYSEQISRIFNKHCVECHRAGEIGPFSLAAYEDAAPWAETIVEVVRDQRMPPWNANPAHGKFRNERTMTPEEKQLVYDWVAAGSPPGDARHLPHPPEYVKGWRLPRTPDLTVAMRDRPFIVPAEGTVEYQYFVVDPDFQNDRWISACEVVPGNRAVVHHAIVFVRPPGSHRREGFNWLGAYVPGQQMTSLPRGRARRVPAGSKLIFQMHYTPNGSPQEDVTRVGIVFADAKDVREEVVTLVAINREFEIPANASNHLVTATLDRFPSEGKLLAVAPHMHFRGKSFRFTIHNPDDRDQIIADIPRYDFNWQHVYEFEQPLPVSDRLTIECSAWFDNSVKNPANPDPNAVVRWGDQTWEEMAIAFFEVAVPVGHEFLTFEEPSDAPSHEQRAEARRKTVSLFERFDSDRDEQLLRAEVPSTFAVFAFEQLDQNGDGVITPQESEQAAVESMRQKRLPF